MNGNNLARPGIAGYCRIFVRFLTISAGISMMPDHFHCILFIVYQQNKYSSSYRV